MRLAFVLFRGELGGAEIVTAELARAVRKKGVDATVVFALTSDALAERLEKTGVPYRELAMPYHRDVLLHPRRLARLVGEAGDGAVLVDCAYLGLALRAGGYRGRIVGVEHGPLLELRSLPLARRVFMRVARVANARADDIEVAVSQFMLDRLKASPHANRILCIPNGIEVGDYGSGTEPLGPHPSASKDDHPWVREGGQIVVASAGRFVRGKGFDVLLRAFALIRSRSDAVVLRLAGGGPDLDALTLLAEELGIAGSVHFHGPIRDMPALWRSSDIAVIPSDTFPESFSMVTLEAMASALPIVATRNGGIPELVLDGLTGTLVPRGDPRALADAILAYALDPVLRKAHGDAARQRCVEHFDISKAAGRYLTLFGDLVRGSKRSLPAP